MRQVKTWHRHGTTLHPLRGQLFTCVTPQARHRTGNALLNPKLNPALTNATPHPVCRPQAWYKNDRCAAHSPDTPSRGPIYVCRPQAWHRVTGVRWPRLRPCAIIALIDLKRF